MSKNDKKIIIGISIATAMVLLLAGIISWVLLQRAKIPSEEEVIEKQLRELEELRGETQPLSEEEIKKQLKELEKLRQSQQDN